MPSYRQDPDAVLDYTFNWSDWLDGSDELASHTIDAEDGITVDSSSHTATAVTVWLSGGTVGEDYSVTCHITTNDGRADDRTMTLRVRER